MDRGQQPNDFPGCPLVVNIRQRRGAVAKLGKQSSLNQTASLRRQI
jgi:hypothetical protein